MYQFRGYSNPETTEVIGQGNQEMLWLVIYDHQKTIEAAPGYRLIKVCPVDELDELFVEVQASTSIISTIGVSLSVPRLLKFVETARDCGVSRICKLGEMSTPSLGGHHDGWFSLSSLLTWTDIDSLLIENVDLI
jgi:hypothetical protein